MATKPTLTPEQARLIRDAGDKRTEDGLYYVRDVLRLAFDADFQKRFGADEEMNRLWSGNADQADRDAEDAQSLGMSLRVAGVDVPPVKLGHIRLLTTVGNEFVSERPQWGRGFEFQLSQLTEALFVLHFGPRAVTSFADYFRWRKQLEVWRARAENQPEMMAKVMEAERKAEEGLKPWTAAVHAWAAGNVRLEGEATLASEIEKLDDWIASAFRGFNLFPQIKRPEDKKKASGYGIRRLSVSCARGLVRLALRLIRSRFGGRSL